ncbi:unnamed protein product, partial [Dicrocoelium dendriticum]
MWLAILGQNNSSLALATQLLVPICEQCINSTIERCSTFGTTILLPLNINPSWVMSSSRKWKNGVISLGRYFLSFGHLFIIVCFSSMDSSSSVHRWSCCKRSSVTAINCVAWTKSGSSSFPGVSDRCALDSVSAICIWDPGRETVTRSYFCRRISILCRRRGTTWSGLRAIDTRGLWSVKAVDLQSN